MTSENLNLDDNKRLLVIKALNTLPTKSRAAKALGICERSLYKLIKRYGVKMGSDGRYYGEPTEVNNCITLEYGSASR